MATSIKHVGIVSKPKKAEVGEIVPGLIAWLHDHGIESFIDRETGAIVNIRERCLSRNEMPAHVDMMIVLGGDGTLLATARALNRKPVPILAVNLGGLGFLTEVTREALYPTLERVVAGAHQTDHRVQIEGELIRADEIISPFLALNDVVLNKGAIARMFDLDVRINDEFVSTYKADGLIVSTPTGSTAYSLAAGGPIVAPSVEAFIITPICAHTLTHRALVIPNNVRIEVTVKNLREIAYLTIDGQVGLATHSDDLVRMRKSDSYVELIRPPATPYFEVLRRKLKWGER